MQQNSLGANPTFPYKIACLCELRDHAGRYLLIHRKKHPNKDLYSPIGGKLETDLGESPAQCAQREIAEEAGLDVPIARLHLAGIISERGFASTPATGGPPVYGTGGSGTNWLIFWYRLLDPVDPADMPTHEIDEGKLEWVPRDQIDALDLPETDRLVIWPTVLAHEGGGFFTLHLDCTGDTVKWELQESVRR
ncbi:MAG: NUDIX domain-containing protein [Phycisphaerales bacterium]|nr:NUDIX domain-containing protein [Phycisphaerales bacterium]